MTEYYDKPCAAQGLSSFRAKGRYGWIMTGAKDMEDALIEANRSSAKKMTMADIEVWDGNKYVPVQP